MCPALDNFYTVSIYSEYDSVFLINANTLVPCKIPFNRNKPKQFFYTENQTCRNKCIFKIWKICSISQIVCNAEKGSLISLAPAVILLSDSHMKERYFLCLTILSKKSPTSIGGGMNCNLYSSFYYILPIIIMMF